MYYREPCAEYAAVWCGRWYSPGMDENWGDDAWIPCEEMDSWIACRGEVDDWMHLVGDLQEAVRLSMKQ